jgi:broad specificity phosphatase PhoE
MWSLSAAGRARVHALVAAGWLKDTTRVVSSAERKAVETAEPIAVGLAVELEIRERMHENDRSATGFLPPAEFERVADEFFAYPQRSIRGWERAIDAQQRIVAEVESVLANRIEGDVLLVGHGAVGTLLFCHYAKKDIARIHDQPPGGGNYFTFRSADRHVLHGWRAMEAAVTGRP